MSNPNIPSFPDFGKLVPGFDFLQNLTKQAGSTAQATSQLPNLANWIAPTLNVEELDKRVQELKAVQFWLDQNAAALKATIQALEVQKMPLATLKGMDFNMGDVANAFKLKIGDSMAGMQQFADQAKTFAGLEIPASTFQAEKAKAAPEPAPAKAHADADADEAPAATGLADPMQWWGALTQQFQTIAAEAMKEVAKTSALDATKNVASDMAKDAVKTVTDMAKGMAESATKTMTDGARAASSWAKPEAAKPSSRAAPKAAAAKAPAAKKAAVKSAPKAAAKPKAPARKTTR